MGIFGEWSSVLPKPEGPEPAGEPWVEECGRKAEEARQAGIVEDEAPGGIEDRDALLKCIEGRSVVQAPGLCGIARFTGLSTRRSGCNWRPRLIQTSPPKLGACAGRDCARQRLL
jgi:hypothetical protein